MLTKEKLLNEAKNQACKFITDRKRPLTSSQLRRFFGEVKRLERKYKLLAREKGEDEAFNEIEPMLGMLAVNANYTWERGKIPDKFREFLENSVRSINSGKQFEEFAKYFEAVVGHYYYEAKKAGLKID